MRSFEVGVVLGTWRSTEDPSSVPWTEIRAWAGPWPLDERWWDTGRRRRARLQVVTGDGQARLLTLEHGQWHLEATYD